MEVMASGSGPVNIKVYWERRSLGTFNGKFVKPDTMTSAPTAAELAAYLNAHREIIIPGSAGNLIGDRINHQLYESDPVLDAVVAPAQNPVVSTQIGTVAASDLSNIQILDGKVWFLATNVKTQWSSMWHYTGTKIGAQTCVVNPDYNADPPYPTFP